MPAAHTDNRGYWIGFAVVLALLFVAPLVLPEFWRRFTTELLIWGLLALSSDILIISPWTAAPAGANGLTFRQPALGVPGLFAIPFTPVTLHWFVVAIVTISYLLLRRITQSPFGMVLQSIRENEPRTRAIGYAVERYKIVAVMLSGVFAGLAGVLYAVQNKFEI